MDWGSVSPSLSLFRDPHHGDRLLFEISLLDSSVPASWRGRLLLSPGPAATAQAGSIGVIEEDAVLWTGLFGAGDAVAVEVILGRAGLPPIMKPAAAEPGKEYERHQGSAGMCHGVTSAIRTWTSRGSRASFAATCSTTWVTTCRNALFIRRWSRG